MSARPLSSRTKLSTSSTTRFRATPDSPIRSTISPWAGDRLLSAREPMMPITPCNWVRNSWLRLARNSLLIWLEA